LKMCLILQNCRKKGLERFYINVGKAFEKKKWNHRAHREHRENNTTEKYSVVYLGRRTK